MVVNTRLAETDKWAGLCERYFWILAFGIILISILTSVFDFSLMPPSPTSAGATPAYAEKRWGGLFITRPYYGLHSWASANRAWAARSHVKYGLGYTKGYRTLAVGDPPPAHPQRSGRGPPKPSSHHLDHGLPALGTRGSATPILQRRLDAGNEA